MKFTVGKDAYKALEEAAVAAGADQTSFRDMLKAQFPESSVIKSKYHDGVEVLLFSDEKQAPRDLFASLDAPVTAASEAPEETWA